MLMKLRYRELEIQFPAYLHAEGVKCKRSDGIVTIDPSVKKILVEYEDGDFWIRRGK